MQGVFEFYKEHKSNIISNERKIDGSSSTVHPLNRKIDVLNKLLYSFFKTFYKKPIVLNILHSSFLSHLSTVGLSQGVGHVSACDYRGKRFE